MDLRNIWRTFREILPLQESRETSTKKDYNKTNKMYLGKINIRQKSLRANESSINANYRGVGLAEMANCIQNNKKHRCNGDLSFHVLDIIQSIMIAAKKRKRINIKSSCSIPKKFSSSEIRKILK